MDGTHLAPGADIFAFALDTGSEAGRERVRLAVANFGLAFFETDLLRGTVTLTPNAFAMFGLPSPPATVEVDRAPFWAFYHPEDVGPARARFEADLRGERGRDDYCERVRILRADDGALRWVEFSGRMFGPPGARTHIVGMLRDVTAAVEAEERQRLLAREVEHRANNALAVVHSLVRLTGGEDLAAYRRSLEGRILALARSQSLALDGPAGAPVPVPQLIASELAAYAGHVEVEAADLPPLAPLAVQPVAMILHELATNAAKHGALSAPAGRVRITAGRAGDEVALRWEERGGPPCPGTAPARSGTGMGVVRAQVRRLGGALDLRWDPPGLTAELRVPLARWAGGGGAAAAG